MHFADPKANVLQLGLREGMKIGDFGAGSGHYALAASAAVGEDGKVYAVDIQEDILAHIKDIARTKGIGNIETVWGNVEKKGGSRLRDQFLDGLILSNILFQVQSRDGIVAEAKRVLKPEGKLLLIDWAGAYGGIGPDPKAVISEHAAEDLFISAGFHKVKSFRAGPHHYGLVFSAP